MTLKKVEDKILREIESIKEIARIKHLVHTKNGVQRRCNLGYSASMDGELYAYSKILSFLRRKR